MPQNRPKMTSVLFLTYFAAIFVAIATIQVKRVPEFCGSFMLFLSCVCYDFERVCLLMPCGHLLGKG